MYFIRDDNFLKHFLKKEYKNLIFVNIKQC
jgi:hypothetical protein